MCLSELQETLDISVINLHEKLIEGDFVYLHMKKYLSILLNNVEVVHFVQIPFRAHLSCYSDKCLLNKLNIKSNLDFNSGLS